jgi:hypothetical protein
VFTHRSLLRLVCVIATGIVVLRPGPAWSRDADCTGTPGDGDDGDTWSTCDDGYQEDYCLIELPGEEGYCTIVTDQWVCSGTTWVQTVSNDTQCIGAYDEDDCDTRKEILGCHAI